MLTRVGDFIHHLEFHCIESVSRNTFTSIRSYCAFNRLCQWDVTRQRISATANRIREMFRRKQNQIGQLISATSLEATSEGHHDIHDKQRVSMSSMGVQQRLEERSYYVKKPPARRSKSLEGSIDNIDHVTVSKEDKGKPQQRSQPHGPDENTNFDKSSCGQQKGIAVSRSPNLGRRLQNIASSPSNPPTKTVQDTRQDTVTMKVEEQASLEPRTKQFIPDQSECAQSQTPTSRSETIAKVSGRSPIYNAGEGGRNNKGKDRAEIKIEDQQMPHSPRLDRRSQNYSKVYVASTAAAGCQERLVSNPNSVGQAKTTLGRALAKTNYPTEPVNDPFRDRTDTANSIKFDISYDL